MLLSAKHTVYMTAAAALFVSAVCAVAQSQDDQDAGDSRSVRIIAAPSPSPAPAPKSPNDELATPPLLTPATPPAAVEPMRPASLTPAAPSQEMAAPSAAPPSPSPVENPVLAPESPTGEIATPPVLTPATPPAAVEPIRPASLTPAAPSQDMTAPSAPALLTPAVATPQNDATAPPRPEPSSAPPSSTLANTPTKADTGAGPTQQDLEALAGGIKIPNAAGLSMKILPGPEVATGSRVSFSVSSKKGGYLILVDIDAAGKLMQIYPNPMSLMAPGAVREQSNFLGPGKALQIPDPTSPYAGFEFIASPPTGAAMVVALLSDRPVQLVDLPDIPAPLLGSSATVDYLIKVANELRIPNAAAGSQRLDDAHWSFDVKFYAIR